MAPLFRYGLEGVVLSLGLATLAWIIGRCVADRIERPRRNQVDGERGRDWFVSEACRRRAALAAQSEE